MKFHMITFGCQMNVADSDWLSRAMRERGWEEASEEDAQVFIVNTCSVREKPELKVYSQLGRLRKLLKNKPAGFVAVGGCVAQQIGTEFWKRFDMVRLVFGTDGTAMVPQTLEKIAARPRLRVSLLDFTEEFPEREEAYPEEKVPAQAFVNIMQGCNNFCAYCIVPYVRGRQKSRSMDSVLSECKNLVQRGARELTLLGQNVNSYGQDLNGDDAPTFAELLYKVAAIPGLERLRFTTSHPKDIAPEVIKAFGELKNLCPYLHLPVQAGSDRILKLMGRKYDTTRYRQIIADLREARPDIALSTDFIVGFPAETDEDFQQTMDLLEEVRFESSFSFLYNDRPGVRSVDMEPKVPDDVKGKRLQILQARQDKIKEEWYDALVGTETDVLFERLSGRTRDDGLVEWRGRDTCNRVVNAVYAGDDDLTGRLATVSIELAKKHSLWGRVVSEPW